MKGPFTNEQLDLLFGDTDNMVFLMKQTEDSFAYEYINPYCRTIFKRDLTGTTVDESMPPELAGDIKKHYTKSLESKQPYTYRDYNLFSEHKLATETEVTSFSHESGNYLLALSKNVSIQKKMEEDYSFYQSLVRNSVDPMIMITAEFTVFDMNPAYEAAFGVRKKEWIGRNYAELPTMKKKLFEEVKSKLDKLIAGEPVTATIFDRVKQDGETARFSANYSPIYENGVIRAFHIVLR